MVYKMTSSKSQTCSLLELQVKIDYMMVYCIIDKKCIPDTLTKMQSEDKVCPGCNKLGGLSDSWDEQVKEASRRIPVIDRAVVNSECISEGVGIGPFFVFLAPFPWYPG